MGKYYVHWNPDLKEANWVYARYAGDICRGPYFLGVYDTVNEANEAKVKIKIYYDLLKERIENE